VHGNYFFPSRVKSTGKRTGISITIGVDTYSNYIWRGTKFGMGPALQPSIKITAKGFTLGSWGSLDASGYTESDIYASYTFDSGLFVGITDYYFGAPYFTFGSDSSSHAFEINLGFVSGGLSLNGNYILNKSDKTDNEGNVIGAGSRGGDLYFEAGYSFSNFKIFAGAGNGWHTLDDDKDVFGICNAGLSAWKEIRITDRFSIPLTGSAIWNPQAEKFYIVIGFSL